MVITTAWGCVQSEKSNGERRTEIQIKALPSDQPSNTLELDYVQTNNAGSYQVVITNGVGSVTSTLASLAVDGSPVITMEPTNTSVVGGSNAYFSAGVSSADPLSYQWYYYYQYYGTATALADGTNPYYNIYNAAATNAGYYYLVVSDDYTFDAVTSSVVTLTVLTPPQLLTEPTNVVTATNHAVSFSVAAGGATPLRATWWRAAGNGSITNLSLGSVNLSNTTAAFSFTGGNVQGNSTNQGAIQFTLNLLATYSALTNVSTNGFYIVLSNSLGVVTSSVAMLTVEQPPKITSQPGNVSANPGDTVFFTVGVSGGQPLSYQWYVITSGGTNGAVTNLVSTGTTNTLELDNVQTTDTGGYQVVVANAVGSVTSSVASLTVDGSPAIIMEPTNTSVVIGSNTLFGAGVNGAYPLTCQWYFYQTNSSATALPDGTNVYYIINNAQTNNAGYYYLIVSNNFNTATSSVVTLTVLTPPLLLTEPANVFTATNHAVFFSVVASGAAPMRGTWWRNAGNGITTNVNLGSVIFSNATTTASFLNGNVQAMNATNLAGAQFNLNLLALYSALTNAGTNTYYVVITNTLGSVTSSVATLTVLRPPKITNQPLNVVTTNLGGTVFFTVGVSGSQPMDYQWYFISGGMTNLVNDGLTNTLELDNISTNNAGNYLVIITNAVGRATSSLAALYTSFDVALTPPQLWLLTHDPINGDGLMIALEAGKNYRVQSSADLSQWQDVTNFLSQSTLVVFTNTLFTNLPALFYRVVSP
jgi:hypothetical protein